jgi:molybdopterin-binding protein
MNWRYPADGSLVDVTGFEPMGHVGVIGPNGSGKTTLLRLMAGTLGGSGLPDLSYLPQRPHMFRTSVATNLAIGLDAEEANHAVLILERLGLGRQVLQTAAGRLSGGERQKVALARVLGRRSRLVLLDEPLTAIAAQDRAQVMSVIHEAIGGRASVVVAHDLDELVALVDELLVMFDGRIRQRGTLSEVLASPVDLDVARLMGVSNLLEGVVRSGGDGLVEVEVGGLTVFGTGDLEPSVPCRVFFPAESVSVHRVPETGSPRNRWRGTVGEIKPHGRLVELTVDVGFPVVAWLTQGSAEVLALAPGEVVELSVKATAVRVVAS